MFRSPKDIRTRREKPRMTSNRPIVTTSIGTVQTAVPEQTAVAE